ncbi:hypothetical protein Ga0080574_TMP3217 [Salipiger abyssi]|uniref:Uncharacterized protein n=1 Tax=Salipiger abyssi TaxID=1250539 RepID=A0A1P8UVX2_9RHOB|nr:hypothetical protein Ga0080574_TMP3217 [Salipiger abyssi]
MSALFDRTFLFHPDSFRSGRPRSMPPQTHILMPRYLLSQDGQIRAHLMGNSGISFISHQQIGWRRGSVAGPATIPWSRVNGVLSSQGKSGEKGICRGNGRL